MHHNQLKIGVLTRNQISKLNGPPPQMDKFVVRDHLPTSNQHHSRSSKYSQHRPFPNNSVSAGGEQQTHFNTTDKGDDLETMGISSAVNGSYYKD